MINSLKSRFKEKYRTMAFPNGEPSLPERFAGKPELKKCPGNCSKKCIESCPVNAIELNASNQPSVDLGKCIFCRKCEKACDHQVILFGQNYQMSSSQREMLSINCENFSQSLPVNCETAKRLFKRSFKLRQVSAGGCNACEADANVLGTPAWDMGRFGIQFVASPRHADALLVTGPVTQNMKSALLKTYDALPEPRIVIASGACAISGGIYADHQETNSGLESILPVDLYVPGCPPHPLVLFDALLKCTGNR